jgi:hypothetical protein
MNEYDAYTFETPAASCENLMKTCLFRSFLLSNDGAGKAKAKPSQRLQSGPFSSSN